MDDLRSVRQACLFLLPETPLTCEWGRASCCSCWAAWRLFPAIRSACSSGDAAGGDDPAPRTTTRAGLQGHTCTYVRQPHLSTHTHTPAWTLMHVSGFMCALSHGKQPELVFPVDLKWTDFPCQVSLNREVCWITCLFPDLAWSYCYSLQGAA